MNLLDIGNHARLYLDQASIPEDIRKDFIDNEIYHVDVTLLHRHRSALGDMIDVMVGNDILCLYSTCFTPLVYVLTKDGEILSVHATIDNAVSAIEEIERIDENAFSNIIKVIKSELVYESPDAVYRIHTVEMNSTGHGKDSR